MKMILLFVILLFGAPAWAASITFTSTADQDKGAVYACSKSDYEAEARAGVPCTGAQAKGYAVEKFQGVLDSWKAQREQAVANRANLGTVFRDASTTEKCAAMTALGIADPGDYLPVGEVCP